MTIGSPGISSFEVNAVPRTSPDGSPLRTLHHRRKRRHVYHLAGYDPIDCDAQYRRFARQLDRFKRTWPVQASMSELVRSSEQSRAWWTVQAHADDWQVETVHEVLLWDDIVRVPILRARCCRALAGPR
jgi:hypothetical protein